MQLMRSFGVNRWRFFAILAAIFVLLAILIYLAGNVRRQLHLGVSAPRDNMQWTLSQLDVEHSKLSFAIMTAMQGTDQDLANLRRRFDLYYSRIEIVAALQSSEHLPANPEVYTLLKKNVEQTQELAKLVDVSDDALRTNLPLLLNETQSQYKIIRQLNVVIIKWLAGASDARRHALASLLYKTLIVAGLLGFTLILAFVFLRLSVEDTRFAQKNLSDVTARLQSTIGASLDAVIVTDEFGELLDYNGAAMDIFGYTQEEAIGQNAIELLLEDEGRRYLQDGYEQLQATKEGPLAGQGLLQMSAVRKGGEIFPIEASITSVMDRNKKMIFISFMRDISERIAASEALRNSRDQALKTANMRSDFIAVMSHEMRTPLNGVIAAHEILTETELTPHQNKFLTIARSSAIHLLQHVNDVLDISSIDAEISPKGVVFSPLETITDVIESTQSLARERGNTINTDFKGADNKFYFGAEVQLRRILINLLGNAIKFTTNGSVQVDFGIAPQDEQSVLLELHVSDSGRGIPQSRFEDIFNDFVRLSTGYDRDTDGTGLGLSITRRLVRSMGGEIGVESEVGVGSTFWITLPLEKCEQPQKAAPPAVLHLTEPSPPRDLKGLRALIVEDNEINRTILRQFLKDIGFEVLSAANGKLGLKAANDTRFDYVFMDVSMPILDGISATRALKSDPEGASYDSTVIGFTAHSSPTSQSECLAAGMSQVLVKPVTREAISEAIWGAVPKPSTPPMVTNALVDLAQVEGILSVLGPKQFAITCNQFKTDLREGFEQLHQDMKNATNEQPLPAHIEQIHSLAGLCASMGASDLHRRLEVAQQLAESHDLPTVMEELLQASDNLEATVNSRAYSPP